MTRWWDDLVTTALLGTERRQPEVRSLPPGIAPTTVGSADDTAGQLLAAAAAAAPYRRAGALPLRGVEPLVAAPSDPRPPLPPAAATRLADLLVVADEDLLGEWLGAATRYRPPGHLVPALLDSVRGRPALHGSAAVVAGPRGRWLAGVDEGWRRITDRAVADDGGFPPEDTGILDDAWTTGTPAQRLAWFAGARRRDPDAARDVLTAGWAAEDPRRRVELLEVLRSTLVPADEPFLEQALDDRRKEVRTSAAAALSALPVSALSRRMHARLATCLGAERRLLRGNRVRVDAPTVCDSAMHRDGITAKPPRGTGERAWWLRRLAALAPLTAWTELTGADTPADVLTRLTGSDWRGEVVAGLAEAAVVQRDPTWAAALLRVVDPAESGPLLAVVPPADRAELVVGLLRERSALRLDLLAAVPRPWPEALARYVLPRVAGRALDDWEGRELARLTARRSPSRLHAEAVRLAPDHPTYQRAVVDVLRARHDMLEELR